MSVFIGELRKIWNLPIVVALVALSVLYYLMFASYYVTLGLAQNEPTHTTLELARAWAGRYGPTIDADEHDELARDVELRKEHLAEQLAGQPVAQELGIASWDDLQAERDRRIRAEEAGQELPDDGFYDLWRYVFDEAGGYEIGEIEGYLIAWDAHVAQRDSVKALPAYQMGNAARSRIDEIAARDEDGYLSVYVVEMLGGYVRYLAIHVVLAVVALVAPVLVRDRVHRVRQMQLVTRSGWRVMWAQLAATLASAVAVALLCIAIYAAPLVPLGLMDVWESSIGSLAWDVRFPWFDMGLGAYLMIRCGMVMALGVAGAAAAFACSRLSAGYVGVLLKVIPLFMVLGPMAAPVLFDATFCIREPWVGAGWVVPPGGELIVLAAAAAVTLAAACALCARQRTRSGALR